MTGAGAAGARRAACVVGIDVGGTTLKGGVCDRDAAIVHRERRPTARDDADALVDGIVALAGDLAADVERTGAQLERSTRDPMAELVRIQRFAVREAIAAGRDPDNPPHLTRSVVLP